MFRLVTRITLILAVVFGAVAALLAYFDSRYLTPGQYVGECGVPCEADVRSPWPYFGQTIQINGKEEACNTGGNVKPYVGSRPLKPTESAREGILFGDLKVIGQGRAPRDGTSNGDANRNLTLTIEKLPGDKFRARSDFRSCNSDMLNGGPLTAPEDYPISTETTPVEPEGFVYTLKQAGS